MPIYDLRCPECLTIQKDVVQRADAIQERCDCGATVERVWLPKGAPNVHIFLEGFYEHVSYEGKHFSSRRQLKDYCKENGLVMDYVEGR